MVYRRAREMATCPLDEALFRKLVLFAWQLNKKEECRIEYIQFVGINSAKGCI
jgi:hypothetical protein